MSPDVIEVYESLDTLRKAKDEWRYVFMNNDEYKRIGDVGELGNVYWREMLYRAHIIVLVSVFKTLRWIEAIDLTVNNYYGFCASLRGLIESCGDSYYTLSKVPLTLANDFFVIREQLNGKSSVITYHEALENEMLHYIQATKIKSSVEKCYPQSYKAKNLTDYIKSIDNDKDELLHLYSVLCGLAHPSYESTRILLFLHEGETIVCNDSYELEKRLSEGMLEANRDVITFLFRVYYNNILSTICLLNEFGYQPIETHLKFESQFKKSESWREIEQLIHNSKQRYQRALNTGEYK